MATATDHLIRPVTELDLDAITRIDERIRGAWRPEEWERRVGYYLRRDPEGSFVAEIEGRVVGFMLGEARGGEFGLEETTGWIEVLGVDPDARGRDVGRSLAEAMFAHFRSLGATQVRTLVSHEFTGISKFFASLGFEREALDPLVKPL